MLFIFLPLLLATTIVTQFVMKKTYYSEVSLKYYDSVISSDNYSTIQAFASGDGTAVAAAAELRAKNIAHANGSEITSSEIQSGLSFEKYVANTLRFRFSFVSTDSTITYHVLNEVTSYTLYTLKNDKSTASTLGGVTVADPVSEPKQSNKNKQALLFGVAASLVAAVVSGFIAEIALDEVYDNNDIEMLGSKAYEISLPKSRKEKK